jgi:DNA invertase Pin-like site-specific DNA recombinase
MTKASAYSYVRFSSARQAEGDSLRRQTEAAAEWCSRNKVRLDTTTTLHDLGRSAFSGKHRENPDRNALAAFLALVEKDRVPRGSYLVIENLDRLSREHILPALTLLLNLIQAGVRVVQLKPAETIFDEHANPYLLMLAIIELSRGHSESAMKSERSRANWQGKWKRGGVFTKRLPAWVVEVQGKLELDAEKAKTIRKIFDLAIAGYGTMRIVQRLTREGVPTLTGKGHWVRSYLALILGDRRVLGEYAPRDKNGATAGDVIKGYYPAVITADEFDLARSAASKSRRKAGRVGNHVNLWSGLLFNARGGDKYFANTRAWSGKQHRVLVNLGAKEGRRTSYTFALETFESAVLGLLRELDPQEILNGDQRPDDSIALAAEKARVEARIAELGEQLLESGDVAALAKALRTLEARNRDLASQLAEAKRKASHPLSETWGEAKGLLAAAGTDESRTRLRMALRALVHEAWLLVVPRNGGSDRYCAVQLFFQTDDPAVRRRRDYLIFHRAGRNNGTPASSWCVSLADVVRGGDLDLRDRDDAAALEKILAALDPAELG